MTLDLEAESKAAAERKATNSGMDVQHVRDMTTATDTETQAHATHRGEEGNASFAGLLIKLIIAMVVIAAIVMYAWPKIREVLHR